MKHLRLCKNKKSPVKASAAAAQVTQSDMSVRRDAHKPPSQGVDETQIRLKEEFLSELRQVNVTGSSVDADKEPDKEPETGSMPVVSTNFSLVDSDQSLNQEIEIAPKRKRLSPSEARVSAAHSTNCIDDDELFLLSLLPSMKRLTIKKRVEVRMKFQQVLYDAEFEV